MQAQVKQLFEMITCWIIKIFLFQCPQDAPPFPALAFSIPLILLFDYFEIKPSYLTFQKSCPISYPDTLALDTLPPDPHFAQVPPIPHANHPIRRGNHPIRLANHPILRGNHPRFLSWAPHLKTLFTVHCALSTA